MNIKMLLETTRTLPNKFYCSVLRCLLHILRIIRGKEIDQLELDAEDHEEVIEIIKDRYFKILQESSNLPSKLESCSLEMHVRIFDLKREYFHKFTDEKDLYKFCLKSKEIRYLL